MTNVILENKFSNILELGFRHGVSTCYMAGALDELGGGKVTTIDLKNAIEAKPNIEELLKGLNLSQYVDVYYEPTSYTWRLMKMLEEDPTPRFDFCYIDGAHDWFTDGLAFFLVDKLLKKDGLILFDDLYWSYEVSPALRKSDRVKNMPEDERACLQVEKVYDLLVKTHPNYGDFKVKDGWAYAWKRSEGEGTNAAEFKTEIIYTKEKVGLGSVVEKIARGLANKLN